VVLVNLIFLSLDFEYFICVMPTKEARTTVDSHTWSILEWLPEGESGIALSWACLYLWMFQTVLLGLGIAPRFQAFGVFFWFAQFQAQNNLLWNGEDNAMRLLAFFLTFFPPNDGCTIWDLLSKKRSAPTKSWPMVSRHGK
jgi:hypothetical protein